MSDIFLNDKGDGGALSLEGGDLKSDGTFFTAIYISLFGGDTFSNVYEKYETNDDFINALNQTITSKNLKIVENKCEDALKWLIDEGVAESVKASAYGNINEKINVDITIQEPSGGEFPFAIIWENEKTLLKRI